MQARICPGEEVSSMGWTMVFATIGAGYVAKWLLDLVERFE